jgi:thioredoxin-related protein
MTKIILTFLFLFLAILTQAQTFEPMTKFNPVRNPEEDLKMAIDYAKATNKRIILDVGGEWCIWCHRIDDFMNKTEEVKSLLDKYFVIVKINYSKENKNEKFLSQYPAIEGYPHFFVLEGNGKLLHSQNTGELEKDKDYDKDKFLSFLNNWLPQKKNKQ